MSRHVFDELTLEAPDELLVTTILAARVDKNTYASNLVVTRDRLRVDESASTYVARQLVDLAKNLKRFRLHGREDVTLGGLPAHRISCGWLGAQGPVEQRITFVVREQEPRALTFTITVPKAQAEELLPGFEAILASLKIA